MQAALCYHAGLLIFYGVQHDNEEPSVVKIYKPKLTWLCPAVSPKGRAFTVSTGLPLTKPHLRLLLLWLKQMSFQVFPVRTRSLQKYLHSNEPHLHKHQRLSKFTRFMDGSLFRSPRADLLLLSACQGVTWTHSDGLELSEKPM